MRCRNIRPPGEHGGERRRGFRIVILVGAGKRDDQPALSAKVARLSTNMKGFAEKPRDVVILDEAGKPVLGGDHERRFFEAAWMFKRGGRYYFTYSTGDTHFLNYAIGDNPYGPFRYVGHILKPVPTNAVVKHVHECDDPRGA